MLSVCGGRAELSQHSSSSSSTPVRIEYELLSVRRGVRQSQTSNAPSACPPTPFHAGERVAKAAANSTQLDKPKRASWLKQRVSVSPPCHLTTLSLENSGWCRRYGCRSLAPWPCPIRREETPTLNARVRRVGYFVLQFSENEAMKGGGTFQYVGCKGTTESELSFFRFWFSFCFGFFCLFLM